MDGGRAHSAEPMNTAAIRETHLDEDAHVALAAVGFETLVPGEVSAGRPLLRARRDRRFQAAVAAALLVHAALLLPLLVTGPEPVGAGGQEMEAISVEIVSAAALESVATEKAEAAAAPADASLAESAAEAAAAPAPKSPAEPPKTTPPSPEPPRATEPAVVVPPPEWMRAPPQTPPEVTPAVAAVQTPNPPPEPVPDAQPAPREEPPPRPPEPPTPPAATTSPSAPAAASRGTAEADRAASAAARATPGAIAAFARAVAGALGRSKPRGSSERGTVRVAFVVALAGGLDDIRVTQSSGKSGLDAAAVDAVRRASLPKPPAGLTVAERTFALPYHFR